MPSMCLAYLPERAAAWNPSLYRAAGYEVTDRFYVPPDLARPFAEQRWNAVWRAAGLRPPRDGRVDLLRGRKLLVEVTRRDGDGGQLLVVSNYLPAGLNEEPRP